MASAKEKHWKSPIVCAFVFPFYVSTDLLVLSLIQMIPAIRQYRVPQRWTWQNIVIKSIRTIFTSHFPDIKPIKICCCVAYVQRGSLIWQFKWGRAYFLYQVLGDPVSPFFGQTRFLLVLLVSPFYSHCISIIALWDPFNEFYIYILYIYIPHVVFSRVFWLFWTCNMRDVRQPWPCLRHAMAFQARSGIDSCNSMLSAYVTGHCRWLPKKWWGKFGDVHTPLGFSE
jgi:hypothetical protein